MQDSLMKVEVAYATPESQVLIAVDIEPNATIQNAIDVSGILARFPEIDLTRQAVGVFSQRASLQTQLREGDRVEIYRPLLVDPKERRRRLA
jgi:uncharacterized protein